MREKGCQDKVSQRSKKLCERKGKTLCESVCEREREREVEVESILRSISIEKQQETDRSFF